MSAIFMEAAALWKQMKDEYDAYRDAAHARAERETNGVLVNAEGKAKGIYGTQLFRSPEAWARKYASEELLEHWEEYPRPNLKRFEDQWIKERVVVWQ